MTADAAATATVPDREVLQLLRVELLRLSCSRALYTVYTRPGLTIQKLNLERA